MMKYEYVDEKFLEDGHTMFPEDVLTRLKRLNCLEDDKIKRKTKIMDWHNLIVQGLNNGLTHTHMDGRRDDIKWVRKRLQLWESFGRCIMDLETEQDYKYVEKELIEIAKEGYKKDEN